MHPHLRVVAAAERNRTHADGQPISVVLADDHAAVLRSLRQVLDDEDDIQVVGEAHDLDSLAREMRSQPRVLALDPSMPGASGIETLREIHGDAAATEIVVLTMNDEPSFAQRALDAGATGFVLKDMADAELPAAVRNAAAGERYVSPTIAARLAQRGPLS